MSDRNDKIAKWHWGLKGTNPTTNDVLILQPSRYRNQDSFDNNTFKQKTSHTMNTSWEYENKVLNSKQMCVKRNRLAFWEMCLFVKYVN